MVQRVRPRPPSRLRQLLTVLVAAVLTVAVWERRGTVAGVVALATGLILVAIVFRYTETFAWSRRHPGLDSLLFAPLIFILIVYVFDVSLAFAAVVVAATYAVLLPVFRRRSIQRP